MPARRRTRKFIPEVEVIMKDGFIKVAAATPEIHVADCAFNADNILTLCQEANEQGVPGDWFSGAVSDRIYLFGSVFA